MVSNGLLATPSVGRLEVLMKTTASPFLKATNDICSPREVQPLCPQSDALSLMCFDSSLLYNAQYVPASRSPIETRVRLTLPHHNPTCPTSIKFPTPTTLSPYASFVRLNPIPISRPSHPLPLSTRLVPRLPHLHIIQYLRSIKDCIALSCLSAQHLDPSSCLQKGELTADLAQRERFVRPIVFSSGSRFLQSW
jgi:hypothetical protein